MPQLVPIFQSALNNQTSPQRQNVAPITAITGRQSSNPVTTFLRCTDCHPISVTAAQLEAAVNVADLVNYMDSLYPLVHDHMQKERERIRDARGKGQLSNFPEGDYVLVAPKTSSKARIFVFGGVVRVES